MTREELLRREYVGRVERVVDYIYAHLGEELGIDELADVAAFSRFHFHRVFASVVGETVSDFTKRVRLQHAAMRLADRPEESVTVIAMAAGFSSPSVFARAFRERFGMTASEWRALGREERRRFVLCPGDGRGPRRGSTDGQADSNGGKAPSTGAQEPDGGCRYDLPILQAREGSQAMTKLKYKVEVRDLPAMTVAYARHVGRYDGIGEAFERLGRWAGPRGLYGVPGALSLAIYHDSPETTETSKLRSSACVSVAPGTAVSGDIGLMDIPGGKYACARFEISKEEFGEAWDALMAEWFPSSGWQPDDRPCFEIYLEDPDNHPEGKFVVDICEPVRPL